MIYLSKQPDSDYAMTLMRRKRKIRDCLRSLNHQIRVSKTQGIHYTSVVDMRNQGFILTLFLSICERIPCLLLIYKTHCLTDNCWGQCERSTIMMLPFRGWRWYKSEQFLGSKQSRNHSVSMFCFIIFFLYYIELHLQSLNDVSWVKSSICFWVLANTPSCYEPN